MLSTSTTNSTGQRRIKEQVCLLVIEAKHKRVKEGGGHGGVSKERRGEEGGAKAERSGESERKR